jgi:hypothetical protein
MTQRFPGYEHAGSLDGTSDRGGLGNAPVPGKSTLMASSKGGGMRQIADLVHEAPGQGDAQRRTQIRGSICRNTLFAHPTAQTERYALEHADDADEGWLISSECIAGWWNRAGHPADGEFSRLYMLRADMVKRLTAQGLARRPNPPVDPAPGAARPAPTAGAQ